jgi:DNA-binding response OmpR family regulator
MASLLLVDDDSDILKLGSHVLSAAGHFVFTAMDAEQALDHLNAKKIDLIISDANMPRHSGFDLLQTIKQSNAFKSIPVAFLTGRREKKDIELAMKLGVTDYIVKPLDPFLLIQKVNQILEQKEVESTQVQLARAKVTTTAKLLVDIEIQTLSEVGLELKCSEKMSIGLKVNLDTKIFEEIGIKKPFMKVLSCIESRKDQTFHIKLQFLGLNEADLTKIRAWIFKHSRASA